MAWMQLLATFDFRRKPRLTGIDMGYTPCNSRTGNLSLFSGPFFLRRPGSSTTHASAFGMLLCTSHIYKNLFRSTSSATPPKKILCDIHCMALCTFVEQKR